VEESLLEVEVRSECDSSQLSAGPTCLFTTDDSLNIPSEQNRTEQNRTAPPSRFAMAEPPTKRQRYFYPPRLMGLTTKLTATQA